MAIGEILNQVQNVFATQVAPPLNSFLEKLPLDPQLSVIVIALFAGFWLRGKLNSPLALTVLSITAMWLLLRYYVGLGVGV